MDDTNSRNMPARKNLVPLFDSSFGISVSATGLAAGAILQDETANQKHGAGCRNRTDDLLITSHLILSSKSGFF